VAAELVAPGRDAPASVCPLSGAKTPSRAHRVRYANLEDWDFEVSDAFTVPLCAFHNTEIHKTGNERQWSSERKIDPLARSEGSMEDGSALLHKRDSNRTIADRSRMKRLDYAPQFLPLMPLMPLYGASPRCLFASSPFQLIESQSLAYRSCLSLALWLTFTSHRRRH
jgi:hypothetical protein